MRTAWMVTVQLVVWAASPDTVADAVSNLLTPHEEFHSDEEEPALIDWQYKPKPDGTYFNGVRAQVPNQGDLEEGEVFSYFE